jgi:hypothetical protein
MTTPTEFVLWLNGATGVMGDSPTPEQWEAIKEKLNESLGFLAAKKLLERAEDQIVRDRELGAKRKEEMEMAKVKAQFAQQIADEQKRAQQYIDRTRMYGEVVKRPLLIGSDHSLLREPIGLYNPELSPKACVSEKSDDAAGAMAMAMNYAKVAT